MFCCKDSIELLVAYLDGELPPDEQRRLEGHLNGCPPCVEFIRSYQATSKICRKALSKKMPEELASQLHSFLRDKIGPK